MSNGSGLFVKQRAQRTHLVRGPGGLAGEVSDLRADVLSTMSPIVAFTVDEYEDPLAANAAGLKAALATVTVLVTLSVADFDAGIDVTDLDAETGAPRRLTITTGGSAPSDAPANAVIKGRDAQGKAYQETLALSQSAGTATTQGLYAALSSVELEAGDGTDATLEFGFSIELGLRAALKQRVGVNVVLMELLSGTVLAADAITGTFTDPATNPPFGMYSPLLAANGNRDYSVYYEYDPAV